MVQSRSEHRREEEFIELGRKNIECIERMTRWCKHAHVNMVSAGLLAEATDLPIGSHRVSCPHAEHESESMNLPWIVPKFILENCRACKHHRPNGDTSWGEAIIREHEKTQREGEERDQQRAARLQALRDKLRSVARSAASSAQATKRGILELAEGVFAEDSGRREECKGLLTQAATIGPELFPPVVVDLLLEQAVTQEFGTLCLPVCAELADRRVDLTERLRDTAISAVIQNICPEIAAAVLVALGERVPYPLEGKVIIQLIAHQSYYRPVGGWPSGVEPRYPISMGVLLRCYDLAPETVLEPLRTRLEFNDKRTRIDACGVVRELQGARPQAGLQLLPDLVASLELDDEIYEESADAAACTEIARAFDSNPAAVDDLLTQKIHQTSGELQALLVGPYKRVLDGRLLGTSDESVTEKPSKTPESVERSVERCLDFVKDEMLELQTRIKAAEVVQSGCRQYPNAAQQYFDTLLGVVALASLQTEPPDPPVKIIIPGAVPESPQSAALELLARRQHWDGLKRLLEGCIKEIAKAWPERLMDSVLKCFNSCDSRSQSDFKSSLVRIIGAIGSRYDCQPQVLPSLMKALMDYESVGVRAAGVEATEAMFRYSRAPPPSNVLDVLVLHLRDEYVAVHKTATRTLRGEGRHLNEQQAQEALVALRALAQAYRAQPYELDDICDAVLAVSARSRTLRMLGLQIIAGVFPTKENLVDERILEALCGATAPGDDVAIYVARSVAWCLSNYERDRYNTYQYQDRARFFDWLLRIPQPVYDKVQTDLADSAYKLAERDPWEVCHFAALFSRFGDHDIEAEVLRRASGALSGRKSIDTLQRALNRIRRAGMANEQKVAGHPGSASSHLSEIEDAKE